MNGHKNPNDSHNYHDENHDEIEFCQWNSKRSSKWHSTPEQRTPQYQSYKLWGWCWPMYSVTWYPYPYYDIENTELYNWNVHLKPERKQ